MIWEIFIKPAWYWIITIIPAVFGVLSVIKDFFPENIKNNYWLWLLHLLPKWAWLLITIIAFVITFVISAFRYFKDRENKASTTNITKVKSDGQSGGITAQQVIAESIFQGPVYIHTAQGNLQKNAKKNKRKTIAKAAKEICLLEEKFKDEFKRIKICIVSPREQSEIPSGEEVVERRRKNTETTFHLLTDKFEAIKFELDCRKDIEDNLQKLWGIFVAYSRSIRMWNEIRSMQSYSQPGVLLDNSYNIEMVFGESATKDAQKIDKLVEEITRLLVPYIREEK